tara:strand:+ start:17365 stop:17682 length:318 start_codon:yes stop_codon:yes gene_type:complete
MLLTDPIDLHIDNIQLTCPSFWTSLLSILLLSTEFVPSIALFESMLLHLRSSAGIQTAILRLFDFAVTEAKVPNAIRASSGGGTPLKRLFSNVVVTLVSLVRYLT